MAVHDSAASFNRAMERRVREVQARADRLTREAVVRAAQAAINATALRSGHLASQWRLVAAGARPEVASKREASPEAVHATFAAIQRQAATVRAGDHVELANAVGYAIERAGAVPAVALQAVALWLDSQRLLGP